MQSRRSRVVKANLASRCGPTSAACDLLRANSASSVRLNFEICTHAGIAAVLSKAQSFGAVPVTVSSTGCSSKGVTTNSAVKDMAAFQLRLLTVNDMKSTVYFVQGECTLSTVSR